MAEFPTRPDLSQWDLPPCGLTNYTLCPLPTDLVYSSLSRPRDYSRPAFDDSEISEESKGSRKWFEIRPAELRSQESEEEMGSIEEGRNWQALPHPSLSADNPQSITPYVLPHESGPSPGSELQLNFFNLSAPTMYTPPVACTFYPSEQFQGSPSPQSVTPPIALSNDSSPPLANISERCESSDSENKTWERPPVLVAGPKYDGSGAKESEPSVSSVPSLVVQTSSLGSGVQGSECSGIRDYPTPRFTLREGRGLCFYQPDLRFSGGRVQVLLLDPNQQHKVLNDSPHCLLLFVLRAGKAGLAVKVNVNRVVLMANEYAVVWPRNRLRVRNEAKGRKAVVQLVSAF